MIANISQTSQLKPLILYNENKIKKGEARLFQAKNIMLDSAKVGEHLILTLGTQSKRKDKFLHVSLNFPSSDIDKLTPQMLSDISNDYLKELGFDDSHPSLIYQHDDTNHPHLHIVTSKILSNGKSINDSHLFRRSQKITRELEIKYNLQEVTSIKNTSAQQIIPTFDSLQDKLNYHINHILKINKVESLDQFKSYLNNQNLDLTILDGKKNVNGKEINYSGLVYHDLSSDFKRTQTGIKSSRLKDKPTITKLEKVYKVNKIFHKKRRRQIKGFIDNLLNFYEKTNVQDFADKLKEKGVDVSYKYSSDNQLVGVSFTDMNTLMKYKGEKIGKAYTAQKLAAYLTTEKSIIHPTIITQGRINKVHEKINHLSKQQQLMILVSLGFKIKNTPSGIYLSSYRNEEGSGYLKFFDNEEDLDFKTLNKFALNLNKDISLLPYIYQYNDAKLFGDKKQERYFLNIINNKLDSSNSKFSNYKHLEKDIGLGYDNLFNQEFIDPSLSDADKKRKKKRKRKL